MEMSNMDEQTAVKIEIDKACRVAREFANLYYETFDKKRDSMPKMYSDTGVLCWNGNGFKGHEEIQLFLNSLPPTIHTLITLDAQPILDPADGQSTCMIQASGRVKYTKQSAKVFEQNFLITEQGGKWYIVSDCIRIKKNYGRERLP